MVRAADSPSAPSASPISVMRGRMLLLSAGCIWGTYAVLLKAINSGDSKPLPAIFVTAARYQFLCLFAFLQKKYFALRSAASSPADPGTTHASMPGLTLAAVELAAIAIASTLLSIWGVALIPSVTSEILASTVHIFVPLLNVLFSGSFRSTEFGIRTWTGCCISFCAAVCVSATSGDGGAGIPTAPLVGQAAVVASAMVLALQRVRAQQHLKLYPASLLNNARMLWMGYLSLALVVVDSLCGGSSAATFFQIQSVALRQWALMALSVFLSAFVAAGFQYEAQAVIPAANAQPFLALQPIFTAAWARLLHGEPIPVAAIVGGCAQICGAVIASKDKQVLTTSGQMEKKQ